MSTKKRTGFKTHLQTVKLRRPKRDNQFIFKTFIHESPLNEQSMHKLLQSDFNKYFDKSYEELLIEELKKPSVKDFGIIQLFKRINDNSSLSSQNMRNIELTVYLLQHLKPFYQFVKFNAIDINALRKVAYQLKYQFYPKNTYIYYSKEYTKKFYGIIKGSVSMRKKIVIPYHLNSNTSIEAKKRHDSISEDNFVSNDSSFADEAPNQHPWPNELRSQFEVEQRRLTSGMCFGEWNLIDNTTHSTSAYCNEDTHLFSLTKDHFDATLSKLISQAVIESKKFVFSCIPLLTQEDLNQLKPEYYDKGNIIYTQFSKANEFFVVYQGECLLKHDYLAKSIDEIYEKRNPMKIKTIVDRGGIAGLESENPNANYEDNLFASQDFTIIYRFNTKELEKKINIRAYLRHLKKEKMKLLTPNRHRGHRGFILDRTSLSESRTEVSDVASKGIAGIKKLMLGDSNKKEKNRFRPNVTNISYSGISMLNNEGKKIKRPQVKSLSSSVHHQSTSRCFLSTKLPTSPTSHLSLLRISPALHSFSNENNRKRPSSQGKKRDVYSGSHKNRPITSIKSDFAIQKALLQLSKSNIKAIVYNSGRYNIPLFSSQLIKV